MIDPREQAADKVALPPKTRQEEVGEHLMPHPQKTRRLGSQLEAAARSLEGGHGRQLHISDVIKRARVRCGMSPDNPAV